MPKNFYSGLIKVRSLIPCKTHAIVSESLINPQKNRPTISRRPAKNNFVADGRIHSACSNSIFSLKMRRHFYCICALTAFVASTINCKASLVSGQSRVFKPQSGFTQICSGFNTSKAFFKRLSISSCFGTLGE